jgi:hypothetical protein
MCSLPGRHLQQPAHRRRRDRRYYRLEGPGRYKTMTLKPAEFFRRFLIHVLPNGFHRIKALRAAGQRQQALPHVRRNHKGQRHKAVMSTLNIRSAPAAFSAAI